MCFDRLQLRLDVENELLPKAAFFLEQPVITVGLQSGDLDGRKHGALLRHEMSHPGARLCNTRYPMVHHPVRQSRGEDMSSEERRVGKDWVRTGRYRGSRVDEEIKNTDCSNE